MVIAIKEEKSEAYVGVIAKRGVISSNEAYHTGSLRGSIREGVYKTYGGN